MAWEWSDENVFTFPLRDRAVRFGADACGMQRRKRRSGRADRPQPTTAATAAVSAAAEAHRQSHRMEAGRDAEGDARPEDRATGDRLAASALTLHAPEWRRPGRGIEGAASRRDQATEGNRHGL